MANSFEKFGKYVLLEKLAAGGMAEVYLAKSIGANGVSKFLAIKRILPQFSDNEEFIDMFKEEAKIAVNLNHGNVVSIYDFGVEKGQFFLVMEYVEGRNLRQIINELKKKTVHFSIEQIVYMIKEVAAGLDHAHRCIDGSTGKPLNITHRDMSPQNIMVSFEGEVKIIDFGIAKAETQLEATKAGTLKGKFGYMSPEQAEGQPIDMRTDVFSLGIVLWELLANDRLFTSTSEAGILRKIRDCQIAPIRKVNPSVHPELERIVVKALAKDKNQRYQTSAALHRDLNRFINTQYPEFSPQDFSVFVKNTFSEIFTEQRRKLVEFAKVQIATKEETVTLQANSRDESSGVARKETFTATLPGQDTSAEIEAQLAGVSLPLPIDTNVVDLKTLKKDNFFNQDTKYKGTLPLPPAPGVNQESGNSPFPGSGHTNTKGPNYSFQTQTRIPAHGRSRLALGSWAIIVAAVFVGAAVAYNYFPRAMEAASKVPTYSLSVSSAPFGARIIVDDQDTEKITPDKITLSEKRTYQISLEKDGYKKFETKVSISKDDSLSAALEQIPILSGSSTEGRPNEPVVFKYTLQSNPSGAKIIINGNDRGLRTPYQIQMPEKIPFRIQIFKEGYFPYEKTISLTRNDFLTATLERQTYAFLTLNIINGGESPTIEVDGQIVDQKPPLVDYQVPARKDVLIRVYNSYRGTFAEERVSFTEGKRKKVELVLKMKK